MPRDYGRLDWMPRLGVWRAIGYKGLRDTKLGDFPTREAAEARLREYVETVKHKR